MLDVSQKGSGDPFITISPHSKCQYCMSFSVLCVCTVNKQQCAIFIILKHYHVFNG